MPQRNKANLTAEPPEETKYTFGLNNGQLCSEFWAQHLTNDISAFLADGSDELDELNLCVRTEGFVPRPARCNTV